MEIVEVEVMNPAEQYQESQPDETVDYTIYIPKDTLESLESLNPAKKYDSTFIRILISSLYQDTTFLKQRSVSGRSVRKSDISKKPFTPQKMDMIFLLFKKRISKCGAPLEEKCERLSIGNVNRLISRARLNLIHKNN